MIAAAWEHSKRTNATHHHILHHHLISQCQPTWPAGKEITPSPGTQELKYVNRNKWEKTPAVLKSQMDDRSCVIRNCKLVKVLPEDFENLSREAGIPKSDVTEAGSSMKINLGCPPSSDTEGNGNKMQCQDVRGTSNRSGRHSETPDTDGSLRINVLIFFFLFIFFFFFLLQGINVYVWLVIRIYHQSGFNLILASWNHIFSCILLERKRCVVSN